jgi:hypothetical protein
MTLRKLEFTSIPIANIPEDVMHWPYRDNNLISVLCKRLAKEWEEVGYINLVKGVSVSSPVYQREGRETTC